MINIEKGLSLYNITNKFVELFEKANDEELTEEEFQQQGEELGLLLTQKSASIIAYDKNLSGLLELVENEATRLTELKKKLKNKHEKYRKYIQECMERLNVDRIDTELGTMSLAKTPTKVEIIDESKIPDEYMSIRIEKKPDKTSIKKYFEETGEIIDGVEIQTNNRTLRIK
jgi:hypothetical protein